MKVVLVNGSKGLSGFLASKAGVDIIDQYSNLYTVKEELYNKMIVADRLLYICKKDTQNFTRDLNTIGELLRNYSQLFKFEEIIFYIEKVSTTDGYPEYINRVFAEFPNQKYTVPINTARIAFTDAYEVLLGKTDAVLNTEARERIFIKPKGSEVNTIYNKDSKKTTLEPFSYDAVTEYDELKGQAVKHDSNRIIQDLDDNEIRMKSGYMDPFLGEYQVLPNMGEKNIILVTGGKASGATTYNNVLAVSTSRANKNTMIINMSDDAMYATYIVDLGGPFGINCYEYSIKNMILKKEFEFTNHLCALTMHEVSKDLRVDALRYFIKNSYKINSDYIFIEVPKELVKEVARLLRHRLNSIFYISESVAWEVENSLELIKDLASKFTTKLWINNETRVRYADDWMNMAQISEIVPSDVEIIDSIEFTDYNINDDLYTTLIGDDNYGI